MHEADIRIGSARARRGRRITSGSPQDAGLGGNPSDRKRNLEAISFLALLLSFGSVSLFSLVTKPVACFPGDIGTDKCPFSATVVNAVTVQMLSSPTGLSISLTTSLVAISGTTLPLDASSFTKFNTYATYSNPVASATFQLQNSTTGAFWSNVGSPCVFASSAGQVFAQCGYQAFSNTGETLVRIEADSSIAGTLTLYDLGVEFHG